MGKLTPRDITDMLDTIPERIRAARIRANLTQEEVAEKIGVSRPAISQYESGASEISVAGLLHLSQALDISPVHLLGVPAEAINKLSPTTKEVISLMEELSPEDRAVVLRLVKGLLAEE